MNQVSASTLATLSREYIAYQNVVVTRAANPVSIDEVSDLHKVSVAAFNNAKGLFGKRYRDTVENHSNYIELDNQTTQVMLFWQSKVDAIVIDINVFNYLSLNIKDPDPVRYHKIFTPSKYRIAFRDKKLAPLFNGSLEAYLSSESHKALQQRYLTDYWVVLSDTVAR